MSAPEAFNHAGVSYEAKKGGCVDTLPRRITGRGISCVRRSILVLLAHQTDFVPTDASAA